MLRRSFLKGFAGLAGTVGLSGPGGAQPASVPLSLQNFFDGALTAKGTVDNIRDGTKRDFTIAMQASWAGDRGTLIEDVAYADGERERKVWVFDRTGEGRFTGTRADVTDEAEVLEDAAGVTMRYRAKTRIPIGLTLNLSFSDRLTRIAPDRVSVRSDVSYLLVSAATVTMVITKTPTPGNSKKKTP